MIKTVNYLLYKYDIFITGINNGGVNNEKV